MTAHLRVLTLLFNFFLFFRRSIDYYILTTSSFLSQQLGEQKEGASFKKVNKL